MGTQAHTCHSNYIQNFSAASCHEDQGGTEQIYCYALAEANH